MIWLFKVNDVYWDNKPKVNEYFTFDVDDIHFDINKYDISLYFPSADYFLLSDSNEDDVYQLRLESINRNPIRVLIPNSSEIYGIIKEFYKKNKNKTSLNNGN
jgi:hypothetical protein